MATVTYNDVDPGKKAFIFELDNVLYPEKDYVYQVYYLFAGLLEYTELNDAKATTETLVAAYNDKGEAAAFDAIKDKFGVDEKYRVNLNELMVTAKLPLKLLLFQNVLTFLQDVVTDRKKVFIVTNGDPAKQLNKIKQIEWHGLEPYLICYFANETVPKPETDVLEKIMQEHNLTRRDMLMIENSETDRLCAESAGIDCINISNIVR
ncbi:HAD family hydrolase [Mucilaginibacter sp.]|uniref:HAD family hydrolase n=1 Tax=Mucilaginibacter sp. TaxID=1882438 RepID=UPI0035BC5B49